MSQEEIVDNIILDFIGDIDPLCKNAIIACDDKAKKRTAMLSLLDIENQDIFEVYKKIVDPKNNSKCHEYIIEVTQMLRKYIKVADIDIKNYGEVMTPTPLIETMLDLLPIDVWCNKDLKWLDPCNGVGTFPAVVVTRLMEGLKDVIPNDCDRYQHIVTNMIYVCEIQAKNMFLYHCSFDRLYQYNLKTYYGSFLDSGFDDHMKNVWGVDKFDIVIANPPYQRKFHLKFFNKVSLISNKSLFVQPSTWLIDNKKHNSDVKKTRELHKNTLDKVVLFNGNPIFNIGMFMPCAITYVDNNKNVIGIEVTDMINEIKITYNSIDDINKFTNIKEYKMLLSKIENSYNLNSEFNKENGPYYVNMSRVRGHVFEKNNESKMYKDDFYTTVTKDTIVELNKTKQVFFSFRTRNEGVNFISYLKTNFSRFCLSICKNAGDLRKNDFSKIPCLDFTQEWSDEKLYKKFNLTKEEINFIDSQIPKYY